MDMVHTRDPLVCRCPAPLLQSHTLIFLPLPLPHLPSRTRPHTAPASAVILALPPPTVRCSDSSALLAAALRRFLVAER